MNKILLFIGITFLVNGLFGQDTILGTYLPVVNTEIKQVWIHSGVLGSPSISLFPLPTDGLIQGNEYFWDYSSMPTSIETGTNKNTHSLITYHPDSVNVQTAIGSHLPNFLAAAQGEASHVSHWTSPIPNFTDMWTVSLVNESGMYSVGHVNADNSPFLLDFEIHDENGLDSKELIIPSYVDINTHKFDTSVYYSELPIDPFYSTGTPITVKQTIYKELEVIGWGSIKTPIDSLGGVLLGRERVEKTTRYYDNPTGTINDTLLGVTSSSRFRYYFLRNNTFATSLIMEFDTDTILSNPTSYYAWYTLPSKVGSIEGTVFDTTGSASALPNAEVYLFREHSNFTRNDVLATVTTDVNGVYIFEEIPYGQYRVAARMMPATQNGYDHTHTYMTYFEGSTPVAGNPALGVDWRQCDLITSTGPTTLGKDIYIRHDALAAAQASAIPNQLTGDIFMDQNGLKQGGDNPVPGIDIIIKEAGISAPVISTTTDSIGVYSFENIPDGSYKLWVDMPGLGMTSSYEFTVINGVYNRCEFDFDVGNDDIFREDNNETQANDCLTGLDEFNTSNELNKLTLYPNPFENNSILSLNLEKESNVSIAIYDLAGKLVLTVVNEVKMSGEKEFNIDGFQASGIYFVKVSIDEEEKTIRLIKL